MDERHQNILKKRVGILAAVVIVLFALIGGLVVYNTPENRLARQLDLGERYLEEQNYAEAVLAFEKAIQIDDRCMAAYVNGIEAYRHLDESENLLSFYEKALEAARSLEGEALTTDMEAVVSIYLAAEDVYTDRDALITLWEEGYEKNGKDSRVQDNLVSVYLEQAEERASSGAYEESLQTYDRLLELDGQDEAVRESLSKSLKSYMDHLMEEENFDRIRELEEKYASVIPNFDFEFYSNEILRIQLELPFAPEDVTIFGYKLTEDHFDDIVADLNLPSHQYYRGDELRWHYHRGDDKSDIEAEVEDDGYKYIDVSMIRDKDSRTYEPVWTYVINPNGAYGFTITNRGLNWLQDHYAPGDNLPLISCLGKKMDAWYRSLPIDVIKEIGEYREYPVDNSSEEYWEVEEPVRVTFSYWHDPNGGMSYGVSYIMYQYPTGYFASWVYLNHEGIIDKMVYQWGPAIRYSP